MTNFWNNTNSSKSIINWKMISFNCVSSKIMRSNKKGLISFLLRMVIILSSWEINISKKQLKFARKKLRELIKKQRIENRGCWQTKKMKRWGKQSLMLRSLRTLNWQIKWSEKLYMRLKTWRKQLKVRILNSIILVSEQGVYTFSLNGLTISSIISKVHMQRNQDLVT